MAGGSSISSEWRADSPSFLTSSKEWVIPIASHLLPSEPPDRRSDARGGIGRADHHSAGAVAEEERDGPFVVVDDV